MGCGVVWSGVGWGFMVVTRAAISILGGRCNEHFLLINLEQGN